MLRIAQTLNGQLLAAMERAFPAAAEGARAAGQSFDPQLAPATKPEFGDFQANGALPLAKPLGQPPRAIATAIVAQLQADPAFAALCLEPQIAGPGFINLTLKPERLAAEVAARLADARLGVRQVSCMGGSRGSEQRQGAGRRAGCSWVCLLVCWVGWLVRVVGTCAEVGAQAGCRAAQAAASAWCARPGASWELLIRLLHARWALDIHPHAPADAAATCLLAVARRGAGTLIAQLGDGMVMLARADGS